MRRHAPPLPLALLLFTTACGQWSGAPVTSVEPQPVPLGPGSLVTIAREVSEVGRPAVDAWAGTAVVSWVQAVEGGTRAVVMAATSTDAGATFGPPVRVGEFPVTGSPPLGWREVDVGVAAPAPGGRQRAAQVWVRAARGGPAQARAWHSRDAGRTYVELAPSQSPPGTVFPEAWVRVDGETPARPRTLRLLAGGVRRAAGIQAVPLPPGARGDPAAVVDEHGALALAWREVDEPATMSLVVRRAWVDWNAAGGEAPGFDAAYALATLRDEAARPAIARVPGGVIVSWADRQPDGTRSVFARRLGMDMTCTRESTAVNAPR